MQRLQAYKFELKPNGEQQRSMRRFAGSCRFVFNKALALKNLEGVYRNFFDKRADFPRFKKKGQPDSFRYLQGFRLDQPNNRVFLPKLGWIRYRNSRGVADAVKNVTVSQPGSNKQMGQEALSWCRRVSPCRSAHITSFKNRKYKQRF